MSRTASGIDAAFIGRSRERDALTEAVIGDSPGVVVVRGGPGSGKSALISRWLDDLQSKPHPFQRIFAGSAGRSANARSPGSLLERLLQFLPKDGSEVPAPLVDQLLHALRRHPTLIVLDGIDEFVTASGDNRGTAGSDLWLWLRECGRTGSSRVVVSTRVRLPEVEADGVIQSVAVTALSPVEGAELLYAHGVRGSRRGKHGRDDPDLQAAAKDVGGHPLGLTLLARYLVHVHEGDVTRRSALTLHAGPASVTDLVAAFERWFDRGPEQSALALLALSDGLTTQGELERMAADPRLAALSSNLAREGGWEWALRVLGDCGLVKLRDDGRVSMPRQIQECLRESLQRRYPQLSIWTV